MFVLYHYFNEAEIYNAIRIFIAAYVWMTGFGNFSYYYIKADFSIQRFAQMMWRLNFCKPHSNVHLSRVQLARHLPMTHACLLSPPIAYCLLYLSPLVLPVSSQSSSLSALR